MKTFPAMPTQVVNNCVKFDWNPSTQ